MGIKDKNDINPGELSQQAVALAEQLGRIAGTIGGTAENLLNHQSLSEQLTRVRDGAAQMLQSLAGDRFRAAAGKVTETAAQVRRTASRAVDAAAGLASSKKKKQKPQKARAATPAAMADQAHAPGKRHKKPAPTVHGAKKSDERIPKLRTAKVVRQRRKTFA